LGEREIYDWRPGPLKPKIAFRARKGIGFKLTNGEYITEETIEKLQEEIKTAIDFLDPQIEVIVCGEGKQHLVALIFVDEKLAKGKSEELKKTIMNRVKPVGKSMTKIKGDLDATFKKFEEYSSPLNNSCIKRNLIIR